MSSYSVRWGAPDLGSGIRRGRLLSRLAAAGDRLRLVAAPSGCGKTMLVADYAKEFAGDVLWFDAAGEALDGEIVTEQILSWLHGNRKPPGAAELSEGIRYPARITSSGLDRPLVVFDDLGGAVDACGEWLAGLHRSIGGLGAGLAVTTREVSAANSPAACQACVLRSSDLRVDTLEAQGLIGVSDTDELERVAEETLRACQGHIALFSIMARMESQSDVSVRSGYGSLEAWVSRLLDGHFGDQDARGLAAIALLRHGTQAELDGLGVANSERLLLRLRDSMPLVRVSTAVNASGRSFEVHHLAEERLLGAGGARSSLDNRLVVEAVRVVADRGDLVRASYLASRFLEDSDKAQFLAAHGREMKGWYLLCQVDSILDGLPIHLLMGESRLLLLWAEILYELGRPLDSLSRARAAIELARHAGDADIEAGATVIAAAALDHAERADEAFSLVSRAVAELRDAAGPEAMFSLLLTRARLTFTTGLSTHVAEYVEDARCHARDEQQHAEVASVEASLRGLCFGDYRGCADGLAPLLGLEGATLARATITRGTLALSLMEIGRLDRAGPLALQAADTPAPILRACFLPVAGGISWACGGHGPGRHAIEEGIAAAGRAGAEGDLAADRILYSMLLRSIGDDDQALSQAERAYARLSVRDYAWHRRLAAIEVAASLLALDDVAAARRWAENVVAGGFGENRYHAFRAAMVLAECDRREGDPDAGIARLAEHSDHVRSENSNFQAAMYCRAFPELLGMIVAAVGSADIPVHLLRMIPPEHAERSLRASHGWLEPGEWSLLGERLLGAEQFDAYVQRRGEPICRVRLFGGLEVTVDDRVIRERDWKKRKSRLLFAMLVVSRGQDLPREQILETLWPNLSETNARNNFYVAWSAMKLALTGSTDREVPCPYVESIRGRCRIVRDALRSDVDEFEEALATARKAESEGDAEAAIATYKHLSGIYRGDLLPGDVYDDWFAAIRDRCRFDFVDAMLHTVELLLERDDPCEAIVYARRGLQVDPCREDLYQALLRCHVAAGQRSAAVETFVQCKTNLADELGLDPSAETLALYQSVLVMEDKPRRDDFGLP